jgi:hypothetical protein
MMRPETKFGSLLSVVSLLFAMGWGSGSELVAESEPSLESEPVLLGPLTREEIEMAMPEWVAAEVEARPDMDAAAEMVTALEHAEITIFMGTWCSDSGRELPRLWRALDELGVLNPEQIRYIGVDRDKLEPQEWVAGSQLLLVPTIVVSRDGKEAGRIIESSPNGIERDLLALLNGERVGVITASEDLESGGEGY